VLNKAGFKNPTNAQCKESAAVLREHFGEPKKIQGFYKWRVSLKQHHWDTHKQVISKERVF
jgi:hypothetical protein